MITDRDTGRPRGFGFVTFETAAQADEAQAAMSGFELHGREIRVDKSTPKGQGPPRREGGFGGRGGGGGGDRACYDFQKGNCRFGDSCRFSHGGSGGGGGGGGARGGDRGYDRGGDRGESGFFFLFFFLSDIP